MVPPPFDALPVGASPFGFPVATDRKAGLLEQIRRSGVEALNFWAVPHPSLPVAAFPAAARRRETTVVLPVHQELRPEDVQRVGKIVRARPRAPDGSLEWVDDIEAFRDEWERLSVASRNVFATWQWASLWWRHYGEGKRLRIAACRDQAGRVFALLPMYEWRQRPVRILRFIGHGAADQLGPVGGPDERLATATALRRALSEARCDIFLGERVLGDEGWNHLLGGDVLTREAYPLLRFDGSWDAYAATLSSNFRQQIGRFHRNLTRAHDVRFRLTRDHDDLDADLTTLFSLHAARWQTDTTFTRAEKFHRSFAEEALTNGWLRLWLLELDGSPVAAWYGLRFGGAEWYYQAGRDCSFDKLRVGLVLLAHTIRTALNDGVREYRFLRGDEPYKYRFATCDPGVETLALARTGAGQTLFAGARLMTKLRPVRSVVRPALRLEFAG
ncbi:MAG: GNAT family N-acetyltransferase [Actinobacteria bacterium]|nr:GNAT family N-acetyltransferase [Actinomycetota bacterium]